MRKSKPTSYHLSKKKLKNRKGSLRRFDEASSLGALEPRPNSDDDGESGGPATRYGRTEESGVEARVWEATVGCGA
ncbi:hypothetical protein ES288_D13G167300v1 [Gossypium darwinii]|uniref:Uncharacterized protein n=1 Tax=Gossypium darwinii TaxID=34276 RepID=A0A5D1ZZK6_GOSDA|nr:hypothetical protein ES288_D13G167300v1 [Gossypium darwinii]